ncbi:MAG TPA: hypothetical protein VGH98_12940 [Gemmatimonadaceae bacterium]
MRLRSATTAIALSGAALLVPALLPAQFTTYVAPPRRAAADTARPKSPATVAKARADSASRMSLTEMKTWVDSAAGTSTPAVSIADTALASVDTTTLPPRPAPARARSTTTFSSGAIAPNTATSLPTLLVVGVGLVAVGVLVLRLRPRGT